MRLLDSEKVYQYIKETPLIPNHAKGAVFLDLESNATYLQDAVARACFDRILKENDVMREQLASIGKKSGDRVDDLRSVVLCRDCKHSELWYGDKSRCFLWHEDGIDVFNDGFCNYGEKRGKS